MNDLEQRVTDYLLMGTGGSSLELLRELTIEHIALKESTRKMMDVLLATLSESLGESKALNHEMGILRKGIEANAIEAAKVPWWKRG